jgi:hypothetical protein
LDHGAPGSIEFGGIVCRVQAGCLHRLDEQGAGILCRTKQYTSVAIDLGLEVFVEVEQIRQDQPERLLSEEG